MFLTAHRVTSPSSGRSGINAFYYRHGDEVAVDWTNPDPVAIGETEPGILVGDAIEVAPGGNLVRSYLDVVAHDATPVAAVEKALADCRARTDTGVPMVVRGSVGVRFGVELGLEEDARGPEFEDLRDRALGLLRSPSGPSWRGLDPLTIEMSVSGGETAFRLAPNAIDRLRPVAGTAWVPAGVAVRREVREDLAFFRGDILREITRTLLPSVSEERLLALGGVRVVDQSGALVIEWPARQAGGTGYCLRCHRHNTLRTAGPAYRCASCGNIQQDNGLWVAAPS